MDSLETTRSFSAWMGRDRDSGAQFGTHRPRWDEAFTDGHAPTDATIQALIRTRFAASTVLTIAHRLATVIDYDKLVVLHAGAVAESGAPAALLADPASRFSQLVAEVGGESAAQLRATADATAAKRADRSCRGE